MTETFILIQKFFQLAASFPPALRKEKWTHQHIYRFWVCICDRCAESPKSQHGHLEAKLVCGSLRPWAAAATGSTSSSEWDQQVGPAEASERALQRSRASHVLITLWGSAKHLYCLQRNVYTRTPPRSCTLSYAYDPTDPTILWIETLFLDKS